MLKKIALLISLMITSLNGFAEMSAAQNLSATLQNIKTFSAHFEQNIMSQSGRRLSSSEGSLKIQRPGRFNWEASQPNPLRVIADGQHIWTYDLDLEQIIKQDAKTAIVGSPAELLAGKLVNIDKDFSVKYADKSHNFYVLTPKDKDAPFNEIKIGFKNKQLVSMEMKDALGQQINTHFSKVSVNTVLDSKLFVFTPPKGVDVIVNH